MIKNYFLTAFLLGGILSSFSQTVIVQADPAYPIDIDGDATIDFYIDLQRVDTTIMGTPVQANVAGLVTAGNNGAVGSVQTIGSENIDKATKLDAGVLVDASSNFVTGNASVVNGVALGSESLPLIGRIGEFANSTEKYIGVMFEVGADTNYGWIQISLNDAADTLILHGYSYQQPAATGGYTSLEENNLAKNISVKILNNSLSINHLNNEEINISLQSIDGKTLFNKTTNQYTNINTSSYPEGIYIISIRNKEGIYSQKFMLSKR